MKPYSQFLKLARINMERKREEKKYREYCKIAAHKAKSQTYNGELPFFLINAKV